MQNRAVLAGIQMPPESLWLMIVERAVPAAFRTWPRNTFIVRQVHVHLALAQLQLDAIHALTQELKESRQALGVEMMMKVAEWTPSVLLSLGARAMSGPINTIVTNVPGPQVPLYFQGARVRAFYPMVPLMEGMGLGIAVTSYAGTMNFGFNADPDIVPDLERFVALMQRALERVASEAGVTLGEVLDPYLLLPSGV